MATEQVDLERFFALSLDLLCVTDDAGRFVHLNRVWETTLGWPTEELRGRPILELLHPDDVAPTDAVVARMAGGERVANFENRYRHRSGGWRRLSWTAWVDPTTGLRYGVARDVTEARRQERAREDLHAAVLALSATASYEEAVSVVSDQVLRLTRALGVVTTAAAPVSPKWAAADATPYSATAGQPDRAAPPLVVPLVTGEHGSVGSIEVWLPPARDEDHDRRRGALLHDLARACALALERSRAELAAELALTHSTELLTSISDAFYAVDRQWRFTFVNPAAERLLRRRAADILGRPIWQEFPDAVGSTFERAYREASASGRPVTFVEYYPPLDGWFDVRAHPSGSGLAVYFLDVTESVLAARALERHAEQQRAVAELGRRALTSVGPRVLAEATVTEVSRVVGPDLVGVVELVDDGTAVTVQAVAGPAAPDLAGVRLLLSSVQGTALTGALVSGVATVVPRIPSGDGQGPVPEVEMGLRSDAAVPIVVGGTVWGAVFVGSRAEDAFPTDDVVFLQQLAHILGAALDRHSAEERLRQLAERDALTRLPNRTVLRREVDAAVAAALQQGHTAALLLLDLDGFKDVNDSLGHLAGDGLLEILGARLLHVVGGEATVARLGGDEFAVCLPGPVDDDDVARVAEAVLAAVEEPVQLDGLDVTLSASLGAVTAPMHGSDASVLLRHADVAMYRAKRISGRHWVAYDPAVDSAPAERLATITELRAAIRAGELELYYQPVVDMDTGAAVSLEALVRWRHPSRGLIPPGEFIPLAEQTGLIGELTLWVVREATAQARRWQRRGLPLRIAVNVSVVTLSDRQVAGDLVALLRDASDVLSVEVTESALVERRARAVLQELAAAGVACAVDDFGTGFSALAYLRSLPVSTLKIDRAFVADVREDDVDLAIIRSVVDLAHTLGLDVIAEGVESEAVAARLIEVGVHHAQGFHYARPAGRDDVQRWLTMPHHRPDAAPGAGAADRDGHGRQNGDGTRNGTLTPPGGG